MTWKHGVQTGVAIGVAVILLGAVTVLAQDTVPSRLDQGAAGTPASPTGATNPAPAPNGRQLAPRAAAAAPRVEFVPPRAPPLRRRGRDWPLDGNRVYRGPVDAYGGRWIYVRPAYPPRRYAGSWQRRRAGRPVYGDRYAERRDHWDEHRAARTAEFDRYPYNIGRRRDF